MQTQAAFRPPAVPLVTSDPYLSIWSEADHLTDDATRHWTHRVHSLVSLIRIDGKAYRLMGVEPKSVPPLPQIGLDVFPTRTVYRFANEQVRVTLTFMTPLLPDDLNTLSRPVTYLTWGVQSADGAPHRVSLYDSAGSQIAVNSPRQPVEWGRESSGGLAVLHAGAAEQTYLRPQGDDTRIDWGYAYLAAPSARCTSSIGAAKSLEASFVETGTLPASDDTRMPRPSNDAEPALAVAFDLGTVRSEPQSCHAMIAYDEIYSIEYFGTRLRPYWRRHGATPERMLQAAERDYASLARRCAKFDDELMTDAERLGGLKYGRILALAYRECLAANGLAADSKGSPLLFTKENTSNGDIATVDVIFPMDPMLLLLSPTLAKASLVSNFDYAASPHWKFPNAPHDLGTYPRAFGRDDGGEGMPVEESGNMILLTDAVAHAEGNAKFAVRYWPQITQWAKYLEQYGLDPEDQLCTDDFMGHLAHNANLSVKAILALAAYGDLCRMKGDAEGANRYAKLAKTDAAHWISVADAGDHSLLAFDQPNTWSQKYNLVWDRLLDLNVFPPEVAQKEIAFYKSRLLPYGLPLDSRTHLTKTDWTIWSATMAQDPVDFRTLTDPIYRYLQETTARDPIADSYMTDNPASGGMHARPVVGGFFIKMLSDPSIWHKWASRDRSHVESWAPLPKSPAPPIVTEIVPTAKTLSSIWRYTTEQPPEGWAQPGFDDSSWRSGAGGFGTNGTPGGKFRTDWSSSDIWIRRTFTMPPVRAGDLKLLVYHDEDVDVYANGVLAASEPSFTTSYQLLDITPGARRLLVPGARITLAAHCHQTEGGQGLDVGIATTRRAPGRSPSGGRTGL